MKHRASEHAGRSGGRSRVDWRGWLVAAAVGLWTGCSGGGGGGGAEPPPTPVGIHAATTAPVEERLTAVGSVEANETVEVRAEVPGRIRRIAFTEGQTVPAGAVLFELESAKEAAQLAQARAEEEVARQNLERAKLLAGTKAIAQQELDQLASQVAARAAARALQEQRLKDMTLTAPFAGVLGPRRVSVGQQVDAAQSLVTLVDHARVKVVYRVPERNLALYRLGQEARIAVNAYPDRSFRGVVELIDPVVDEATRTVRVRAIADNAEGLMKPGMFARVETVVAQRAQSVVVPETALVPHLDGFQVYVVAEGRARLKPVKLGIRGPGTVEILEGLAVGQEIVITGTQKLVDGTRVTSVATGAAAAPTASAGGAGPAEAAAH